MRFATFGVSPAPLRRPVGASLEEGDDASHGVFGGRRRRSSGASTSRKSMTGAVIEEPLAVLVAVLRLVDGAGRDQLVVGPIQPEDRNREVIEEVGDLVLTVFVSGQRGVRQGSVTGPRAGSRRRSGRNDLRRRFRRSPTSSLTAHSRSSETTYSWSSSRSVMARAVGQGVIRLERIAWPSVEVQGDGEDPVPGEPSDRGPSRSCRGRRGSGRTKATGNSPGVVGAGQVPGSMAGPHGIGQLPYMIGIGALRGPGQP